MTDFEALVETAARAICADLGMNPDQLLTAITFNYGEKERQYRRAWRSYIPHARAAFAAIGLTPESVIVPREPTEAMQAAGLRALSERGLGDCDCDQCEVWEAMLAASPSPKETSE